MTRKGVFLKFGEKVSLFQPESIHSLVIENYYTSLCGIASRAGRETEIALDQVRHRKPNSVKLSPVPSFWHRCSPRRCGSGYRPALTTRPHLFRADFCRNSWPGMCRPNRLPWPRIPVWRLTHFIESNVRDGGTEITIKKLLTT